MEPETKSLLDKLERKGKHYINAQLNVSLRIYACLLNEIIDKTNKYHIGDVILVLDQLKYNLPSAVQVLVVPVFSEKMRKKDRFIQDTAPHNGTDCYKIICIDK